MSDGKVRALCAQIALEINPEKADALIAQLKRLLNGENVDVNIAVTEELTVIDFATRSSDIRREIVDRATSASSARFQSPVKNHSVTEQTTPALKTINAKRNQFMVTLRNAAKTTTSRSQIGGDRRIRRLRIQHYFPPMRLDCVRRTRIVTPTSFGSIQGLN